MKLVKLIAFVFLFLVLGIGYLSYTMNELYNSDENMYVASSVLFQTYRLYTDFTYLQMPYQPILFEIIYKITNTTYYFLMGRLIQLVFILASFLLFFITARKITKDFVISFMAVIIFSFNGIIIWALSYINNSVTPIFFALLSFHLYLKYSEEDNTKSNKLGLLLCGISLAIATGIKIYYAAMVFPLLLAALVFPASLNLRIKLKKQFIPVLAGFFVGLLPVFFYLFKDYDAFMFNNFKYHILNTILMKYATNIDYESFSSKIYFLFETFLIRSRIVVPIGLVVLFAMLTYSILRKRLNYMGILNDKINFALITISIFTMFAAIIPAPLRVHYFALPLPFIILLIASLLKTFSGKFRTVIILIFAVLTISATYYGSIKLFCYVKKINTPQKWLTIKVHNTALTAAHILKENKIKGKIATYHTIFALEGGYDIYREYSSVNFPIRIGFLLSEKEREKYKITSAKTFDQPFEKEKPAAFYVGTLANFDDQLLYYAVLHGYKPTGLSLNLLELPRLHGYNNISISYNLMEFYIREKDLK